MSVNKLAEYAVISSPRRRRTIIKDQKNPPDMIVAIYGPAETAIVNFLADGGSNPTILGDAIDKLQRSIPRSDWEKTQRSVCIDAIRRFGALSPKLSHGAVVTRPSAQDRMMVNGLSISVRPEAFVADAAKGTAGAIKLVFTKNSPVTKEAGEYTAVLLNRYLKELLPSETIDRKLCQVIDVFAGEIFSAPKAWKQKMANVEAACEEIVKGW